MLRLDIELLGHIGDDKGLADGLAAGDRQRLIGIGAFGEVRRDKIFARHFVHRAQHRLIADAAPAQRELKFHAFNVGCRNLGHGDLASNDSRANVAVPNENQAEPSAPYGVNGVRMGACPRRRNQH